MRILVINILVLSILPHLAPDQGVNLIRKPTPKLANP